MDVSLRQGSPAAGTLNVHLHGDAGTALLVVFILGIGDHVAFQGSTAVALGDLDSIELIDLVVLVNTLDTPEEFHVGGQEGFGLGSLEEGADGVHVALAGIAHAGTVVLVEHLQTGEQGMSLQGSLGGSAVVGSCSLGIVALGDGCERIVGSRSGSGVSCGGLYLLGGLLSSIFLGILLYTGGSELAVELDEEGHSLSGGVGLPKLQIGGTLKELAHAVGLLDTGELDHDAALLTLKGLDVGLHDAEAVDTCADDIERVVDGGLHLLAQNAFHFAVGALGVHLAAQLLGGEELSQVAVGSQLLVVLDKKGNKIALTGLGFLLGLFNGLIEVGVILVVGQCLHHIGHRHFEDDVHATLEVKTQTNSHLAALLECPDPKINGFIGERVQVVLSGFFALDGGNLLGLALVVLGNEGEAEVEDAHECKQDCENFYESFVLHFVLNLLMFISYFSVVF